MQLKTETACTIYTINMEISDFWSISEHLQSPQNVVHIK